MPRKENKAAPEGNDGPVPQQEDFGPDQPMLADLYRLLKEGLGRERKGNKSLLDKMDVLSRKMDNISEDMRGTSQCLASLEHDARQPRLAKEAGGQAYTETCERTEGAATAIQAMHGDSCSANRIDLGPKTTSTSFGVKGILPLSLVGMAFWSTTALRRPSRGFHPWRCTHQLPLVAYFRLARPL